MLEATGFDESDLEGIRRAIQGNEEGDPDQPLPSAASDSSPSDSTEQVFATTVLCHTLEGAEAVRRFVEEGELGRASAVRPRSL